MVVLHLLCPFLKYGSGRRTAVLQLLEVMLSSKYLTWAANIMTQVSLHVKCYAPSVLFIWELMFWVSFSWISLTQNSTALTGKQACLQLISEHSVDSFPMWNLNITFPICKMGAVNSFYLKGMLWTLMFLCYASVKSSVYFWL